MMLTVALDSAAIVFLAIVAVVVLSAIGGGP